MWCCLTIFRDSKQSLISDCCYYQCEIDSTQTVYSMSMTSQLPATAQPMLTGCGRTNRLATGAQSEGGLKGEVTPLPLIAFGRLEIFLTRTCVTCTIPLYLSSKTNREMSFASGTRAQRVGRTFPLEPPFVSWPFTCATRPSTSG